jgi:hypothetical protein
MFNSQTWSTTSQLLGFSLSTRLFSARICPPNDGRSTDSSVDTLRQTRATFLACVWIDTTGRAGRLSVRTSVSQRRLPQSVVQWAQENDRLHDLECTRGRDGNTHKRQKDGPVLRCTLSDVKNYIWAAEVACEDYSASALLVFCNFIASQNTAYHKSHVSKCRQFCGN